MTVSSLDFFFPFVVFSYGLLVLFVLEIPFFAGVKSELGQQLLQHLEPKRKLGWICLCVGAAWSMQNLIFS